MTARGLISIGTNSTRALVADLTAHPPRTLFHASIGTRIGEGLREGGNLQDEAMRRTLAAITEHHRALREHDADVRVIATSALRRAHNEAAFAVRVQAVTGARLEIISGEEEAACSFVGASSAIECSSRERIGVLDVGGGSSEYAVGCTAQPERTVSCEVGAVRVTEAFPSLSGAAGQVSQEVLRAARTHACTALQAAIDLGQTERVLLVGGSATNAVGMLNGNRQPFSRARLHSDDVQWCIARLAGASLDERKTFAGINPQRADILLAGLLIIEQFLHAKTVDAADVCTSDVLLGYLLRHAGST